MNNPIMALAQMAMDEYGDADHFKMGRSGMMRVLPEYDRRDQRFDPDEYDIYGRMGYSGRVPHSNMGSVFGCSSALQCHEV